MTLKNTQVSTTFIYGIPLLLLLVGSLYLLVNSPLYLANSQQLSTAIILDLIISFPLVYFLLIRKSDKPKITVVSVFFIGITIASWILPLKDQGLLDMIKLVALPIMEAGVLGYVGVSLYKTYRTYQIEKGNAPDFFTALIEATDKILPRHLSRLGATEIAVIYYAFFNWTKATPKANEYTYHKKSGIALVFYVFMSLALIETAASHLVIEKYAPTVAFVLMGIGLYSCLQIFALTRSLDKRFITISEDTNELILRFGFFNDATINLAAIEKIERSRKTLPEKDKMVEFSRFGHNVILYLNEEHEMTGLYGIKKKFKTVAFYVDERESFCTALEELTNQNDSTLETMHYK